MDCVGSRFCYWGPFHFGLVYMLDMDSIWKKKNNKAKLNIIVSVVGDFSRCFFSRECWEHMMGEWFSCSTQIQVNIETKTQKNE